MFTGRYDWDASCVCSNDPQYGGTGAAKTTAGFDCAPNIDHSNPRVRQVHCLATSGCAALCASRVLSPVTAPPALARKQILALGSLFLHPMTWKWLLGLIW